MLLLLQCEQIVNVLQPYLVVALVSGAVFLDLTQIVLEVFSDVSDLFFKVLGQIFDLLFESFHDALLVELVVLFHLPQLLLDN